MNSPQVLPEQWQEGPCQDQQTIPLGQMYFIAYFCRALGAKNIFLPLSMVETIKKYFDIWKSYEIQILMSINNVFLKKQSWS